MTVCRQIIDDPIVQVQDSPTDEDGSGGEVQAECVAGEQSHDRAAQPALLRGEHQPDE